MMVLRINLLQSVMKVNELPEQFSIAYLYIKNSSISLQRRQNKRFEYIPKKVSK